MGAVLEQFEPVLIGEVAKLSDLRWGSPHIGDGDGPGAVGDPGGDVGRVEIAAVVTLGQDRVAPRCKSGVTVAKNV